MPAAPAKQLKQFAIEIANGALARAKSLVPERRKIELRLLEIEALLKEASFCHERARNFVPQIGRDYQCPRCWI